MGTQQSAPPPPPVASSQGSTGGGKKRRRVGLPQLATRKSVRHSPVVVPDSDEDEASYLSPERTDASTTATMAFSPRRSRSQGAKRTMASRAIPLDVKEIGVIDLTLDDDSDDSVESDREDTNNNDTDSVDSDNVEVEKVVKHVPREEALVAADLFFDLTDESATPMLGHSEALKYLAKAYEEVVEDDKNLYKLSDDIVRTEMAACTDMSDVVKQASQADLFRMTTYGEIKEEAFSSTIIPLLQLRESDVFYDLGCGTAKPVLQVALETTCRVSKGIELFANRVRTGQRALDRLRKICPAVLERRQVLVVQGDIVRPPSTANLVDATVVFINNLVFTDDLMLAVMENLRRMRSLRRVIVSKKLCNRHSIRCEHSRSACMLFEHPPREAQVEASWTAKDVSVYVYVRAYDA